MRSFFVVLYLFLCIFLDSCKKSENNLESESKKSQIDDISVDNFVKEIIKEIMDNYVEEVSKDSLEEGAINGMLESLDKYSMYIPQREFFDFTNFARGEFLGVGVEVKNSRDGLEIVSIIDESPAMISGLKVGDIITHVNSRDVSKIPLKESMSKLNSDTLLNVNVSIIRNKEEKLNIALKKSVIQLESVITSYFSKIAIIKITCFNNTTTSSVKSFINEIKKKGDIVGLIIDLRGNPGGMLDQAIFVSSLFLNSGRIVEFRSKNPSESKIVEAEYDDQLDGMPMAVLIDRHSASGAELMASALGENKRAIIVGEKSYGKGSVQTVIPIPGKGGYKANYSISVFTFWKSDK